MSRSLLIFDPTLKSFEGHSYQYDVSVAVAARDQFDVVEIHADRQFHAASSPPVAIKTIATRLPIDWIKKTVNKMFSLLGRTPSSEKRSTKHATLVPGVWGWVIALGYRLLAADLRNALSKALGQFQSAQGHHEVHVLIQHSRRPELLAIEQLVRANEQRHGIDTVHFHLVLRTTPDSLLSGDSLGSFVSRLEKMRTSNGWRCSFYCDSNELTREYVRAGLIGVETIPVPIAIDESLVSGVTRQRRSIGFFGPPRVDKGFCEIPEILRRIDALSDGADIDVNLQVVDASADQRIQQSLESLEQLSRHAKHLNMVFLKGPLSTDDYYTSLARCSLIIFPYNPTKYTVSTSGIFAEALSLGIPVVCPSGSWMSATLDRLESVHQLRPGVTFDSFEELPSRILGALDTLDRFSAAASRAAPLMRSEYDPVHVVEKMLASASRTGLTP